MSVQGTRKYAEISFGERISLTGVRLTLPFALIWSLLRSPFQSKPWRRVAGDSLVRYMTGHNNHRQLQRALGTSLDVYKHWAKKNAQFPLVDELGENGRLFWIGPKRVDRVLLYLHGGGFVIPFQGYALSFWRYVQLELEKRDTPIGIAVMSYSLLPDGAFPVPLRQATLAIEHILRLGVEPQHLQLVGDSAGGNLILQVLSHMLHPIPSISSLVLPKGTRLCGAYLMSPWVSLSSFDVESFKTGNEDDVVTPETLRRWGEAVMQDISDSQIAYIDALRAPDGWFEGIDKLVDRMLVTTGGGECLRDPDQELYEKHLKGKHDDLRFCIQKDGVHDDPFYDFLFGRPRMVGELTPLIVEWLAEGFEGDKFAGDPSSA